MLCNMRSKLIPMIISTFISIRVSSKYHLIFVLVRLSAVVTPRYKCVEVCLYSLLSNSVALLFRPCEMLRLCSEPRRACLSGMKQ